MIYSIDSTYKIWSSGNNYWFGLNYYKLILSNLFNFTSSRDSNIFGAR